MVAKAGLPQEAWLRAELLEEAIAGRRMTVLRHLLEQGIHPDVARETGNRTMLMELVEGAEAEESRMVLNLLLEKGADPNTVRATEGQRPVAFPLHLALGKRRWQHAGWLLEHGAVPDPAPDGIRPTSLHLVARPYSMARAAWKASGTRLPRASAVWQRLTKMLTSSSFMVVP